MSGRITFIRAEKEKQQLRIFETAMDKTAVTMQNLRLLLCFCAGVIIGTVLMNLFHGNVFEESGLYSEYFVYKFQNFTIKSRELFGYSFWKHTREMLFVLIFCMTSLGAVASEAYLGYKGAGIGILISAYVMQYGPGGVLLYLISIFPHYLPYLFFVILLAEFGKELYRGGIRKLKNIKCIFMLVILALLTSYFETFMNLAFIRLILG